MTREAGGTTLSPLPGAWTGGYPAVSAAGAVAQRETGRHARIALGHCPMRRKWPWILGAVVIAAVAAACYGLFVYPDRVLRDSLDQMTSKLPPGAVFTYQNAHYSVLSRTVTFKGLFIHWTIPGDVPDGANIAIDSLEIDHPATDTAEAFAKISTDPGSITPETEIPIADAMILKGVRLSADVTPVSSSTEWLGIRKLGIYPWVFLHEGRTAFTAMQAAFAPGSSSPGSPPVLQFYAAMILGTRYDAYNERDLYVTVKFPASSTQPSTSLVIGTHKLDAVSDRGTQREGTLDGFTIETRPWGKLSVDHVKLPDFDIRETLLRIIAGGSVGPAMETTKIGPMDFTGASFALPGRHPIPLGDFSTSRIRFDQGKLVSGAVTMKGFPVSIQDLSDSFDVASLRKIGIGTMTASFQAAFSRDIDHDSLSVFDTRAKIDELGAVALQADLVDVARGAGLMSAARIAHAALRYDDVSLVRRLLLIGTEPAAAGMNTMPGRLAVLAKNPDEVLDENNPEMAAAARAVADFVRTPHSLTIALSPPKPIPVSELRAWLAGSDGVPPGLGLTVSANQP